MFNNSWKQPTPTDINFNESLTFLDRAIFREILSLCQNEKRLFNFVHNNRNYSVELKRGQCIFKVSKIAEDLEIDRKRVRRSIETISKWYSQMDSQAMPYGLVITVKDYNNIVGMDSQKDSQRIVKGQSEDSQRTPNKSEESVKSENISKDIEDKSSYGNNKLNSFMEAFDKAIGFTLPLVPQARRHASTCLELFTKQNKKGDVKKGRDFLDDKVNVNASMFIRDYRVAKLNKGFAPGSWYKVYENVRMWIDNDGTFPIK